MVPVETILGLPGTEYACGGCDEIGRSSGVREMPEGRLVSDVFGGAEAGFVGGKMGCLSGEAFVFLEVVASYGDC